MLLFLQLWQRFASCNTFHQVMMALSQWRERPRNVFRDQFAFTSSITIPAMWKTKKGLQTATVQEHIQEAVVTDLLTLKMSLNLELETESDTSTHMSFVYSSRKWDFYYSGLSMLTTRAILFLKHTVHSNTRTKLTFSLYRYNFYIEGSYSKVYWEDCGAFLWWYLVHYVANTAFYRKLIYCDIVRAFPGAWLSFKNWLLNNH